MQDYLPAGAECAISRREIIMKKGFVVFVLALTFLVLVACSGSSGGTELAEKYNALVKEYEQVRAELEALKSEYLEYKEAMKEYESLSEAEAEARRIEAEEIANAARLAEEEQAAAEAAAREEAEKVGYETGITYDQLSRTPDSYEGQKVKFSGVVVQMVYGEDTCEMRLAVDGDYNKIIYCAYRTSIVSSRVLEDDYITVYGVSKGLITYESTFGGKITIPGVLVEKIDQE